MQKEQWHIVEFKENSLLSALFGEQDCNLNRIEQKLGITVCSRGNSVALQGAAEQIAIAKYALSSLYDKLAHGEAINSHDIDASLRMAPSSGRYLPQEQLLFDDELLIKTPKKHVRPLSDNQRQYIHTLYKHEMVFGNGPAGTGKTYLAVAVGVSMFLNRRVERLILSRPALEAGEKIGFLPGDLKEKVDPYMRPIYDALYEMMGVEKVGRLLESKEIEIAPLAFMRGRTLSHSYIILDEAQNTTNAQMKMFLTRLGEGSRMVITGDLSQIDLPGSVPSGMRDALTRVAKIPEIAVQNFEKSDIIRHPLIAKIVAAYEE
jgi:phosphate starvation-inducible PhoH-like protein